jgi:hypothetical protein
LEKELKKLKESAEESQRRVIGDLSPKIKKAEEKHVHLEDFEIPLSSSSENDKVITHCKCIMNYCYS